MKKILLASATALGLMLASGANAATTSGQFNVNITLTPVCTIGAIAPVTFAYTSLAAGVTNSAGGGFNITCTNQLPYSFGLQAGSGAPVGAGAGTISVTDNAVNLTYDLNAPAAGTGSGAAQAITVSGTITGPQSGNCNLAVCDNFSANNPTAAAATNRTQTLIVTY